MLLSPNLSNVESFKMFQTFFFQEKEPGSNRQQQSAEERAKAQDDPDRRTENPTPSRSTLCSPGTGGKFLHVTKGKSRRKEKHRRLETSRRTVKAVSQDQRQTERPVLTNSTHQGLPRQQGKRVKSDTWRLKKGR